MRFAQRMGRKWPGTLEITGFWRNRHANSGSSSGKSGLSALGVQPLHAVQATALVPFVRDDQPAWYVFDLFGAVSRPEPGLQPRRWGATTPAPGPPNKIRAGAIPRGDCRRGNRWGGKAAPGRDPPASRLTNPYGTLRAPPNQRSSPYGR